MKLNNFYSSYYDKLGFIIKEDTSFCPLGVCRELPPELGKGYHWSYSNDEFYSINIHDFFFHNEYLLECDKPECLSISYYNSVSGEELSPYRRLNANCVRTYLYGQSIFKALMHKKIPVKSVGIDIMPEYYESYIKQKYPDECVDLKRAFLQIDETGDFPEMVLLLNQIRNYKGEGLEAKLFFDAKVSEAIFLIVERYKSKKVKYPTHILENDRKQIENVTAYINDHFSVELPQAMLCKIACMGVTKLANTFKQVHKCTITEYIQNRRMGYAEQLLSHTELNMKQISQTIGYSNASRFSELFVKSTGLLPSEYRKIARK